MAKNAILRIHLAPEVHELSDETVKKRILEDSYVPWCKQILGVAVEEGKEETGFVKILRNHGLSETVATNVAKLYA